MITYYRLAIDSIESHPTLKNLSKNRNVNLNQVCTDIKNHLDKRLVIEVNAWWNETNKPFDLEIQIVHLYTAQDLDTQMQEIVHLLEASFVDGDAAIHLSEYIDIDTVDYPQKSEDLFASSCEFVSDRTSVLRRSDLTKNIDYISYGTVHHEEGHARELINRINRKRQTHGDMSLYLPSTKRAFSTYHKDQANFDAIYDAFFGSLVGATLRMNLRLMQWFALQISENGLDCNDNGEMKDKDNLKEIEHLYSLFTESVKTIDTLPPISPNSWFCNQNYYVLNGYVDLEQFQMLLNASVGTMLLINTSAGVDFLSTPPYRTLLMQYSTSIAIVFLYEVYANNPMNATHTNNSTQFCNLIDGLGISDKDIIYVHSIVTTDEKAAITDIVNKIYPIDETSLQEFLELCNKGDTLPNIATRYRKYIANKKHMLAQQRYNELSENPTKCKETELVMHFAALQNINLYDPLSNQNTVTYDDTIIWKNRLKDLVGLNGVKQQIYNLEAKLRYRRLRGCNSEDSHLVYTFEGNPGCGKTMVARLFAYILKQIGILTSTEDPFYEVQISELVGVHLGEATKGVDDIFAKGKGRLIFIDEAYSLLDEGQYGNSAINTIVKNISHMSSDTVLVLAGYPTELNKLLKRNPGLESRISEHIHFDDYSCEELFKILHSNLKERRKLELDLIGSTEQDDPIIKEIKTFLRKISSCDDKDTGRSLGNARVIDNLMEEIEIAQAKHLQELHNSESVSDSSEKLEKVCYPVIKSLLDELLARCKREGTILGSKRPPYFIATDDSDNFDSIIGNIEAKSQLRCQIEAFKHSDLGRGILLTGAPGCGKTSLARAFAHECTSAFLAINASDLINKYVGESREATDALFDAAAEYDKCTLFIDEIDAIGCSRDFDKNNSAQREALYVLLTRLDGIRRSNKKLFVIAATNYPRLLDPALLRRLGTEIKVELPTMDDRMALLHLHLKDTPNQLTETELQKLAGSLQSQSYDTIVQIVTNAKRKAKLGNKPCITYDDLSLETDLELYGAHSNIQLSYDEKLRVAVHEIGHAVISLKQGASTDSISISITPRSNGALGFTKTIPDIDTHLYTQTKFLQIVTQLLGGRAAEEIFFGATNVSNGCSNDLERATDLATDAITHYGMGSSLRIRLATDSDVCLEVDRILHDCYSEAKTIISSIKENIPACAEKLLCKTCLEGSELVELLKV